MKYSNQYIYSRYMNLLCKRRYWLLIRILWAYIKYILFYINIKIGIVYICELSFIKLANLKMFKIFFNYKFCIKYYYVVIYLELNTNNIEIL